MTSPPNPPEPLPTVHEATLASGPSGAVEWGTEITIEEAVERRRKEFDVVVRGEDESANRRLAGAIEALVGPATRPQPPHVNRAGRCALPHFH
jgi:hypothetical protein